MVTAWNVLKRLEHYISYDSNEESRYLSVCVANLEKVFSIIDENCDKNDYRITDAAAAMSYYDFAVRAATQDSSLLTSFKAGDVSIRKTRQSLIEVASKVKMDALRALAPLCKDDSFYITLA